MEVVFLTTRSNHEYSIYYFHNLIQGKSIATMAWNSSPVLSSGIKILWEAFKLALKNKKIFLLITLSTLIVTPLLFIANLSTISSLSKNVMAELISLFRMDPRSPEYLNQLFKIKEDAIIFTLVVIIFNLFMTAISLCSMVATIYASAMSYLGKDLLLMDIFLKLKKIWLRPVITWFCLSLLSGGYTLMILLPLILVIVLVKESIIIVTVGVVLILVIAFPVNLYLVLVWNLGLVSSVLEDCCGLEALGKGQKLVEGRKAVGFLLSFVWMILVGSIIYVVSVVNKNQYQTVSQLLVMYVAKEFLVLASVVSSMVYTVFYFECKRENGEEVEIHEVDMGEYTRASAAIPIVGKDFP